MAAAWEPLPVGRLDRGLNFGPPIVKRFGPQRDVTFLISPKGRRSGEDFYVPLCPPLGWSRYRGFVGMNYVSIVRGIPTPFSGFLDAWKRLRPLVPFVCD